MGIWANDLPFPDFNVPSISQGLPSPSRTGLVSFWARCPIHGTAAADPRTGHDRSTRARRWTEQAWGGMAGTAPWTSWGPMMWPMAGAQAEVPKKFLISEAASVLRHPLPWDVLSPGQGWEMGWEVRSRDPRVRPLHNFILGFSKSFVSLPAQPPSRGRPVVGMARARPAPVDGSDARTHLRSARARGLCGEHGHPFGGLV